MGENKKRQANQVENFIEDYKDGNLLYVDNNGATRLIAHNIPTILELQTKYNGVEQTQQCKAQAITKDGKSPIKILTESDFDRSNPAGVYGMEYCVEPTGGAATLYKYYERRLIQTAPKALQFARFSFPRFASHIRFNSYSQ